MAQSISTALRYKSAIISESLAIKFLLVLRNWVNQLWAGSLDLSYTLLVIHQAIQRLWQQLKVMLMIEFLQPDQCKDLAVNYLQIKATQTISYQSRYQSWELPQLLSQRRI
eukprot:403343119